MKKKIFVGSMLLLMCFTLTGCLEGMVPDKTEEHVHAFSNDWSNDANGHWHACTCDERLKDSFAPHVDGNVDGKCDVCEHEVEVPVVHEHTFASEWSKDETGHWNDSTCDHKVTSNFAAHTAGEEGICTVCGYVVTPPSNVSTLVSIDVNSDNAKVYYNLGDELNTDGIKVYETYENSLIDDSISAVTDLAGYTVKVYDSASNEVTEAFSQYGTYNVVVSKGEVSDSYEVIVGVKVYSSVMDALNAGLENSNKVNQGSVIIENSGYTQEYEYAFGKDYTKVSEKDDESHYQVLEDGSIFGVSSYIDYYGEHHVSYIYEPGEECLLGVNFAPVFSYEYTPYGVDELFAVLIELAKSDDASNYKELYGGKCNVCGTHSNYSFSFDVVMGEWTPTAYSYSVLFELDDNSNTISNIEIIVSATYYVYDETTSTYVPNTEATEPDYIKHIYINQETGERNIENEYSAEVLQFTSFDFVKEDNTVVANNSTIDMQVKEEVKLYLSNIAPQTANPNVDTLNITATTESGDSTYSVGGYYDSYNDYLKIYAYKTGKYNVTISTANVTYSYVLNVEYATLTSFAPALYDEYGEKYEAYYASAYENNTLVFSSYVNSNANPAFVAILEEEYTGVTLEVNDSDYLFTATTAGEYKVNLVSSIDETLTSTLTITIEEAPNMADVINGEYEYNNWNSVISYVFTPESEGSLSGTLVITDNEIAYNFTYTYYESYSSLQVLAADEDASSCIWSVTVDNYQLCCLYYGYFNYGPLTKVLESSDTVSSEISGTYTCSATNPMGVTINSSITFNENGTGTYDLEGTWYYGTFYYVAENGVITFSNVSAMLGTNEVTLSATYSGSVVSLTYETADDYSNSIDLTNGSSNSGDSSSSIETITGGTSPMMATPLETETKTYSTTIGGGNSAIFLLYGDVSSYYITVECDSESVTFYAGEYSSYDVANLNSTIEVTSNGLFIGFANSTLADVTIEFTITIVE